MPARAISAERLLAAVTEQRAALAEPGWRGPLTAAELNRECVRGALAAADRGQAPAPGALRAAVTYLLGMLAERAPGRAVEVRVPPWRWRPAGPAGRRWWRPGRSGPAAPAPTCRRGSRCGRGDGGLAFRCRAG
jgi:hypothetical protein